jgi:hypothetical protein
MAGSKVRLSERDRQDIDDRVLVALDAAVQHDHIGSRWSAPPIHYGARLGTICAYLNGTWSEPDSDGVSYGRVVASLGRLKRGGLSARLSSGTYCMTDAGVARWHNLYPNVGIHVLVCQLCDRHPAELLTVYGSFTSVCEYCREQSEQRHKLWERRDAADAKKLSRHRRTMQSHTLLRRFRVYRDQCVLPAYIDLPVDATAGDALRVARWTTLSGHRLTSICLAISPLGPVLKRQDPLPRGMDLYFLRNGEFIEYSLTSVEDCEVVPGGLLVDLDVPSVTKEGVA